MSEDLLAAAILQEADKVNLMRTMVLHVAYVRQGLERITSELTQREAAHDASKFMPDEFNGFARINRIAREHAYGSEEYRASMATESVALELHYSRNRHHPEYHAERAGGKMPKAEAMTFLDLIEMVCDWRSAYLTYGSKGTWVENVAYQKTRFLPGVWFTAGQWWLIEEVAIWIERLVP